MLQNIQKNGLQLENLIKQELFNHLRFGLISPKLQPSFYINFYVLQKNIMSVKEIYIYTLSIESDFEEIFDRSQSLCKRKSIYFLQEY